MSTPEERSHCRLNAKPFVVPLSKALYATAVVNTEPLKAIDTCAWGTVLVSGATGAMAHILRDAIAPTIPSMPLEDERAMVREIHKELMRSVQEIIAKRAGDGFSMLVVDGDPHA